MTFVLINNEKKNYLGTTFKIPYNKDFKSIRLNNIKIQNNKSSISYNNNCLQFLRKGLDYIGKPLNTLYSSQYDPFYYYYVLDQIFIPQYKKYNSYDDYFREINSILFKNIDETAISMNKEIYLYSTYNEGGLNASYIPNRTTDGIIFDDDIQPASDDGIPNEDNIQPIPEEKIQVLSNVTNPLNYGILASVRDNENVEYLSFTDLYSTLVNNELGNVNLIDLDKSTTTKTSTVSQLLFDNTNLISLNQNIYNRYQLFTSNGYFNGDSSYWINVNSNSSFNFQDQTVSYTIVLYEIIDENGNKLYTGIQSDIKSLLDENYVNIRLQSYNCIYNEKYNEYRQRSVETILLKAGNYINLLTFDDTISNAYYSLDSMYYTYGKFSNLLYGNDLDVQSDTPEEIPSYDYTITLPTSATTTSEKVNYYPYLYSMLSDYYTDTKINNLNNSITNVNVKLKFENKYVCINDNSDNKSFIIDNKKYTFDINNYGYNINGIPSRMIFKPESSDYNGKTMWQFNSIPKTYYKYVFNSSTPTSDLAFKDYDFFIWINPDTTKAQSYKRESQIIDGKESNFYTYYLKEGDQILCGKNDGSQVVIELCNFKVSSLYNKDDNELNIQPISLQFDFIPFNTCPLCNNMHPNRCYNNDGYWFLLFEISFIGEDGNVYTDLLEIKLDDLTQETISLDKNLTTILVNDDFKINLDINSFNYILSDVPSITPCAGSIIVSSEGKFSGDSQTNSQFTSLLTTNNKDLFQDKVISGFTINVTSIKSRTNECSKVEKKKRLFKYTHWYKHKETYVNVLDYDVNKVNVGLIPNPYPNYTYKTKIYHSYGDISFSFIVSDYLTTSDGITQRVSNPYPNIYISNWKFSDLLRDQLFFNSIDNGGLISGNKEGVKLSIDIIPVSFYQDMNKTSFTNISDYVKTFRIDTNYIYKLPQIIDIVNRTKLKWEITNINRYLETYFAADKFFSLFSQFKDNLWNNLGIFTYKIFNEDLKYSYSGGKERIYSWISNTMSEELYLSDVLKIDKEFIICEDKIYYEVGLYDPLENNIYDVLHSYGNENKISYLDIKNNLISRVKSSDFRLYKHGNYVISNSIRFDFQPQFSNMDEYYNLKFSFNDNIDDVINNNINSNVFSENELKWKMNGDLIEFSIEDNNIIYTFEDNEEYVYVYIDSRYHYPFLTGTTGILKIEYLK